MSEGACSACSPARRGLKTAAPSPETLGNRWRRTAEAPAPEAAVSSRNKTPGRAVLLGEEITASAVAVKKVNGSSMKINARTFVVGAALAFVSCVALSLIHPFGDVRAGTGKGDALLTGASVPPDVLNVLSTKCADCHSSNTHWPLYSRIAPGSWLMESDVADGRLHLNMTNWQHYGLENQMQLLSRIASEARSGEMPPRNYLLLHRSAKLSAKEQDLLYDWAKSERKRLKQSSANKQDAP
jgi:Haem-binding domain